jgi:hypothetical protein
MRRAIGVALLLFQVGAIGYARFSVSRYFCWAPHDSQTEYRIEATLRGAPLSDAQIERRYRLPAKGVEARSIAAVLSVVDQYEETYGRGEGAEATVTYRINGGAEQRWRSGR